MIDESIFKAYDIRGIVGEGLSDNSILMIGKAIGSESINQNQKVISVGYDGRVSSPGISKILIEGLLSSGIDVIDIGLVTTPMLYYSTYFLKTGTGVMITGSHNPPSYNGFKMVINNTTLSSMAIQQLKSKIINNDFNSGNGKKTTKNVSLDYKNHILDTVKLKRKMRIAIDCGNGAAGIIAKQLFQELGADVVALYDDVDGNFPNHHPDPSKPENLQELIEVVTNSECEIGLAFDGDADRLGVVNKNGEIIFPDRQLMLFAKSVLKDHPNKTIIFDVKSSRYLFDWIKANNGNPLIWKTGHSLIKEKMKETKSVLAGEMSGHTFFNDKWFGFDDGVYAGARLLEILSHETLPIQEVLSNLPKGVSTPEINIAVNEGEQHKIIQDLQNTAEFKDALEIIKIDGLRVEYPFGFGLMRASNTTPVIVLRFEADSELNLTKIQSEFKSILSTKVRSEKIPF